MFQEYTKIEDVSIVKVKVRALDATNAGDFQQEILNLVEKGEKKFILDLSLVEFIDSSGISTIISIYKTITQDGSFCICGAKNMILNILEITNLKKLIPTYHTVDIAINSYFKKNQ